ncbi:MULTISPECIES: hypothetical protein [unclassified Halorubrum]|uniref:hypothetical protein n=1 Tax=unclassified Halorubrum TaxID=2642239 RepID=UPI0011406972|nr:MULTISPECIES: hypothetical protein [unclassified Halorubrum]
MALLEALREVSWPLREQPTLFVTTTFSRFDRALVGTDGNPSRSGATTTDRAAHAIDKPRPCR